MFLSTHHHSIGKSLNGRAFLSHKGGDGGDEQSSAWELSLPFPAWLTLAFGSSLSLRLQFCMKQTPCLLRPQYCTAFSGHRKAN